MAQMVAFFGVFQLRIYREGTAGQKQAGKQNDYILT